MNDEIKSILCPIDLSDNSLAAIQLATTLAKQHGAKVNLMYVAPQWLGEAAIVVDHDLQRGIESTKAEFLELGLTDDKVDVGHILVNGNPGPEIVRASKSSDMIVMSTHGHTGLMRFLMGSVAQYVMRNADCPVVLMRNKKIKAADKDANEQRSPYVTEIMRQVAPVRGYDAMTDVLKELEKADETAAPVIDDRGKCAGILTMTDIERYRALKQRYENGDESVIDEVFETDQFGLRRMNNDDFDQARRHMTSPVIAIRNDETCQQAFLKFKTHDDINHLVVVDEKNYPVGIAVSADLVGYEYDVYET